MAVQFGRVTCVLSMLMGAACADDLVAPAGFAGAMAMTATSGTGAPPTAAAGMPATPTAGSTSTAAGASGGAAGSATTGTATATAGTSASAAGAPAAGSTAMAAAGMGGAAGAGPDETGGAAGTGTAATAGTTGAVAGASGSAAGAAGMPAMRMDLGKGDGSDVVTIGDSWMSYAVNGGGIEAGLRAASMQRYRNYAVAGTMLLNEVIPNQYESAKRANKDIKTVVMAGGGNDLLLTGMSGGSCSTSCRSTIDRVGMRLSELWKEMAADGVQDVIYIEYSRGGSNGPSVEYGISKVMPACAAVPAPLRCHFVDSDTIIMMQLLDGVHPTADGCRKLGNAVWDLMVKEGIRR